jgi:hypothetical protein
LKGKVQKVLEELDKVKYSGLALNQIIRTIRCYILNKLYYVFVNMDIPTKYFKVKHRIILGRKSEYQQEIQKNKKIRGDEIVCKEQKEDKEIDYKHLVEEIEDVCMQFSMN